MFFIELFLSFLFCAFVLRSRTSSRWKVNSALFEQNTEKNKINSLPNEMLKTILDKLEAIELIACKGVCRKWMLMIEGICRETRSIMIRSNKEPVDTDYLSKRFNGLVDFNRNCAVFTVKSTFYGQISISKDFCTNLAKVFTRVENLVLNAALDLTICNVENFLYLLNQLSPTIVNLSLPTNHFSFNISIKFLHSYRASLSEHIDKLTSLKRLEFYKSFAPKQTTLARLKHCTFTIDDLGKVVPYLGTACTSLYLFDLNVSLNNVIQLFKLNSCLAKGLTHLRLATENPKVLSFVCANFVSLQMLYMSFFRRGLDFNENTIAHFSRLSYLTQLKIYGFKFDLPTLARANLAAVNSVQILTIFHPEGLNDDNKFDGDLFCRVLSHIFPNLQKLTIKHRDVLVRDEITQYLNRFVHLDKHVIAR